MIKDNKNEKFRDILKNKFEFIISQHVKYKRKKFITLEENRELEARLSELKGMIDFCYQYKLINEKEYSWYLENYYYIIIDAFELDIVK